MTPDGFSTLQAIFFDFDGVLAESLNIKTEAFRDLYAGFGADIADQVAEAAFRETGVSREIKIRGFHRKFLGQELTDPALAKLCDTFAQAVVEKVIAAPWVAGAKELVLREFPQRPLFVISGTPHDEMIDIVARRGMAPHFKEVHGGPTAKHVIMDQILERHGFDPARVLMVWDGYTDFDAAEKSGLQFLGRLYPRRENPFPKHVPVVSDFTGLI
ncbi:MAG: HAD family hydrolase [Magnetospiraceae bacterium]